MPAISVLLVTYNAGSYLRESVASILGQTERDLECLLIDNASTDRSVPDVMAEFGADSRLRLIPSETNRRHYGGLVFGLPHARGQYVAIMDADDVALPCRFALQRALLESDPALGLVAGACRIIDGQGQDQGPARSLYTHEEIYGDSQFFSPLRHPTFLFRREVFESVPYREAFPVVGDHDILTRTVEEYRVASVPVPVLRYRVHGGTTTSTKKALQAIYQSVVRLATWRRRSGREENITELLEWATALTKRDPGPEIALREAGRKMAQEGFASGAALSTKLALGQRFSLGLTCSYLGKALLRENHRALFARMIGAPLELAMERDGLPRRMHF